MSQGTWQKKIDKAPDIRRFSSVPHPRLALLLFGFLGRPNEKDGKRPFRENIEGRAAGNDMTQGAIPVGGHANQLDAEFSCRRDYLIRDIPSLAEAANERLDFTVE